MNDVFDVTAYRCPDCKGVCGPRLCANCGARFDDDAPTGLRPIMLCPGCGVEDGEPHWQDCPYLRRGMDAPEKLAAGSFKANAESIRRAAANLGRAAVQIHGGVTLKTKLDDDQIRAMYEVLKVDPPTANEDDPVNHPSHYTTGGVECIDAIEAALTPEQFEGYCRGNAIKYAWRAGRKGEAAEDLSKGAWYLRRAVEAMEREQ